MKTIISILLLSSSVVFAGGSVGTMSLVESPQLPQDSIYVYLLNSNENLVEFAVGQSDESVWHTQKIVMKKSEFSYGNSVTDALELSSQTKDWAKIK